jgi:hypothetical protein
MYTEIKEKIKVVKRKKGNKKYERECWHMVCECESECWHHNKLTNQLTNHGKVYRETSMTLASLQDEYMYLWPLTRLANLNAIVSYTKVWHDLWVENMGVGFKIHTYILLYII